MAVWRDRQATSGFLISKLAVLLLHPLYQFGKNQREKVNVLISNLYSTRISLIYCCITSFPQTQWFKMITPYLLMILRVGKES